MSSLKTTIQPLKVRPDTNHTFGSFIISSGETEEYRRAITVDGQLDSVGLLHLSISGGKTDELTICIATTFTFIPHAYGNPFSWRFWILQGRSNSLPSTKYISRLSSASLCSRESKLIFISLVVVLYLCLGTS